MASSVTLPNGAFNRLSVNRLKAISAKIRNLNNENNQLEKWTNILTSLNIPPVIGRGNLLSKKLIRTVHGVEQYIIEFYTADHTGNLVKVKAGLFIPSNEIRSLAIYCEGTTTNNAGFSIVESIENIENNSSTVSALNLFSQSTNNIVLAVEYIGINQYDFQYEYYVLGINAFSTIDGIQTVLTNYDIINTKQCFIVGYSQGSNVLQNVVQILLSNPLLPDPILAVTGGAPFVKDTISDWNKSLQNFVTLKINVPNKNLYLLLFKLLNSIYNLLPNFDLSKIVKEKYINIISNFSTANIDSDNLPNNTDEVFIIPWPKDYIKILTVYLEQQYFTMNIFDNTNINWLIASGTMDDLVPQFNSTLLKIFNVNENLTLSGDWFEQNPRENVTFVKAEGADHFEAAAVMFEKLIEILPNYKWNDEDKKWIIINK
jgi:hypothetical protein